jgi:hypothetical protein
MLDEVKGSPNQATQPDSGLLALVMLSRFHSVAADPEQLRHEFSVGGAPFGTDEILHVLIIDDRLKKTSGNKQGPAFHVNAIVRDSAIR